MKVKIQFISTGILLPSLYSSVPCQCPLSLKLNKFHINMQTDCAFPLKPNTKHLPSHSIVKVYIWLKQRVDDCKYTRLYTKLGCLYSFHHVNVLQPLFYFLLICFFHHINFHTDKFLVFLCFCICTHFLMLLNALCYFQKVSECVSFGMSKHSFLRSIGI